MANKFLLPVYEKVFGQPFSYKEFDDRLKMQKMVYLLQEDGVNIGHYRFDWYKHGPYSQVLLDDMYFEDGKDAAVLNYTKDTDESIKKLKNMFHDNEAIQKYGMRNWTECLASIHYLKFQEMESNVSKTEILSTLRKRKPHLDNASLNERAYELVIDFVG